MHECPKTHFKHKCMHASHHAASSCHIIMPWHHATSACHVIIPHHHAIHHATSSCHVRIMHFLTTTWQLEGVPRGTSAKIFPVGAKLQNAISFSSGVHLTRPFAPLELDWWAIRHGTIFVAIWWFWKLAFLYPPGSFGESNFDLGQSHEARFVRARYLLTL